MINLKRTTFYSLFFEHQININKWTSLKINMYYEFYILKCAYKNVYIYINLRVFYKLYLYKINCILKCLQMYTFIILQNAYTWKLIFFRFWNELTLAHNTWVMSKAVSFSYLPYTSNYSTLLGIKSLSLLSIHLFSIEYVSLFPSKQFSPCLNYILP